MPIVPDPNGYDKFSEWLADPQVQAELKDIRESLQCTMWQAVIALYMPMLAIPIDYDCGDDEEPTEPWQDPDATRETYE